MSSGKITISVDALGADDAPSVVLDGVKKALDQDPDLYIELCGPADVVEPFVSKISRCNPVVTTQAIAMDEHPANAVRKKKDSSIVVGCKLVSDKIAQGFYSAGNTGACLAAATLITGRIKGVKRPMLLATLPASNGGETVLCDVGANADYKPEYLLQFGIMADAYLKQYKKIDNRKIALLNIGEEESKGCQNYQEAHQLLKQNLPSFVGNAEGRDVLSGQFDCIICDGFSGNICLKTIEGSVKSLFSVLKKAFLSNTKSKVGALLLKPSLKNLKSQLNPDSSGGALLVGVKGACVVGHGNSNATAICNGILTAAELARADVNSYIEKEISSIK